MTAEPSERQSAARGLTMGRAIIVIAAAIALATFVNVWRPGLIFDFFREGRPFDRFALVLLLLIFLPPLVERLRLPGLIGLILGGVAIGPHVLALTPSPHPVADFFTDIGRVFLMFLVGLEIDLGDFRRQAGASLVFGLATFACPMIAGYAVGQAFGYSVNASVLIGSLLASHTLLALPILEKLGLVRSGFALATAGATIFTDIGSLLVLAVCVSAHVSGAVALSGLAFLVGSVVVYCVLVLGGFPWIGNAYLRRRHGDEAAQFQFVLLTILVAAIGAALIHLEDIVGAFLCGIAVNQVLGHSPARQKLEFLGKVLFVPLFFVAVGTQLDLPGFVRSLSSELAFVLAVLAALFGGKLAAAAAAKLASRYSWAEGLTMWSLSLPQLAATLAATITASRTLNPAGQPLINEPVVNAVIVLVVTTAMLGPILTDRFGKQVVKQTQ
ncbi:MAG: cation:proton antiporter [Candidatus Acidiferrales bacterium]